MDTCVHWLNAHIFIVFETECNIQNLKDMPLGGATINKNIAKA